MEKSTEINNERNAWRGLVGVSKFDCLFAIDREMLFEFLRDTQHDTMESLRKKYKDT